MKKGIGFKIITMAIAISVIAAVIGAIGLYTTNRISKLVNNMYQQNLLGVQYAKEMENLLQSGISELMVANRPGKTKEQIANAKKQFSETYTSFSEAIAKYETTENSEEEKTLIQTIRSTGTGFVEKGKAMFAYTEKGDITGANDYIDSVLSPITSMTLDPAIDKLMKISTDDAVSAFNESSRVASLAVIIIVTAILVGLALSLTIGLAITRSITKPVTKVVDSLSDSSSQIGISSTQLSSASQEIANGAQEQASSIEETTSSMEELSSMVKQNLGNTRQASLLSEKATEDSQNGADKMTDMLSAMTSISKSAEDIKNVIDVIDDIAFQTNMLALNAAVEAARAGEAGMGFAVVADEVKNLANRSSESAKETSAMIKDALKNVESGMSISRELSEIFSKILANSKKVMEMNREVETASGQQDEGISQVNKAMIQFDTVVQTNASSAEETASAAEELQSQVSSLNEIVDTLYLLVSGEAYIGKTVPTVAHSETKTSNRRTVSVPAGTSAAGIQHHIPKTEHNPQKTAANHGTAAGNRQSTSETGKDVQKNVATGNESKAKDENKRKDGGHTISFEDDEDFKPV